MFKTFNPHINSKSGILLDCVVFMNQKWIYELEKIQKKHKENKWYGRT